MRRQHLGRSYDIRTGQAMEIAMSTSQNNAEEQIIHFTNFLSVHPSRLVSDRFIDEVRLEQTTVIGAVRLSISGQTLLDRSRWH